MYELKQTRSAHRDFASYGRSMDIKRWTQVKDFALSVRESPASSGHSRSPCPERGHAWLER